MKLLLCIFAMSVASFGQAWSGILDPSRAIDWTTVGATIVNRATICSTLSPGATPAQINSAIAACANGVVQLNPGTYNLAQVINFAGHSNVTLRGSGPTQTILAFALNATDAKNCTFGGTPGGGDICVQDANPLGVGSGPTQPGGSNAHNWTSGYAKGATSLTLDSVSGLTIGQVIVLDQANDTADTGGVFVCDTVACHQSGETASFNGRTIGGVDYNQTQITKITGISGNTITVSPGVYANNWRSAQTPKVWWSGGLSGVGIENLTVDNTGSGANPNSGMIFFNCYGCWVKNVRSIKGNRNHIWLYQSAHMTVRDSYFYGVQAGAQQSYGIESFITSDDLIENNIFQQVTSPIVWAGGSGLVVGYNFSINNPYTPSVNWTQNTYSAHDAGPHMNLFEGNQMGFIDADSVHGVGGGVTTYFRNQLSGRDYNGASNPPTLTSINTHAMNIYGHWRGFNVVGNVLGYGGFFTRYETSPNIGGTCDVAIYVIGFGTASCGSGTPGNDNLAQATLLRWGNYDTVNNAVRFLAAEVPTTAVQFINGNPVPANQALPASFYLPAKPSWWGTMPFPPIGPDVAGGTVTSGTSSLGGHAYKIPAWVCYTQLGGPTNGTGNALPFDASNCYATVSPPNPPTGLSVIVN